MREMPGAQGKSQYRSPFPLVSFLTIGRLCCHLVLRRASYMPAVSRAWAGMQIRRRAPDARTQQAEAPSPLNARWVPAARRRGRTENSQTRFHHAHRSTPIAYLESAAAAERETMSATARTARRHRCRGRVTRIVRIVPW